MNVFKLSDKKKQVSQNNRSTVLTKHEKKLDQFDTLRKKLPQKKRELDKLNKEYQKVKNKVIEEKYLKFDTKLELGKIDDKIKILKKEIKEIESGENEVDYLLDVVSILEEYENEIQKERDEPDEEPDNKYDNDSLINTPPGKGIANFIKASPSNKRGELYQQYVSIVEGKEVPKLTNEQFLCPHCGVFYIIEREGMVCPDCGFCDENRIGAHICNSNEDTNNFAYKRINHFNEWLSTFMARENTDIPDDVINKLLIEIKKERITDPTKLDPKKIRTLLKKLGHGYTKYYENCASIRRIITGLPAPNMSEELEETLKHMFIAIQEPWREVRPPGRKNFPSYSYVIHKFCQLLGEDQFLPYFPLLKSQEKLRAQDRMWKAICDKSNWKFYPSV